MHLVDIIAYLLDMMGFIFRNFTFFGLKCATDLLALSLGITAQVIYFGGLHDCVDLVPWQLETWLLIEVFCFYFVLTCTSGLQLYIYCSIQSPQFQYKYFYSLRNQDNEEDDAFKQKYFN